jgi:hypothetical protein
MTYCCAVLCIISDVPQKSSHRKAQKTENFEEKTIELKVKKRKIEK